MNILKVKVKDFSFQSSVDLPIHNFFHFLMGNTFVILNVEYPKYVPHT